MRFKTKSFVLPLLAIAGFLVAQDLGRLIQSKPQALAIRVEAPRVKSQRPADRRASLVASEGE